MQPWHSCEHTRGTRATWHCWMQLSLQPGTQQSTSDSSRSSAQQQKVLLPAQLFRRNRTQNRTRLLLPGPRNSFHHEKEVVWLCCMDSKRYRRPTGYSWWVFLGETQSDSRVLLSERYTPRTGAPSIYHRSGDQGTFLDVELKPDYRHNANLIRTLWYMRSVIYLIVR